MVDDSRNDRRLLREMIGKIAERCASVVSAYGEPEACALAGGILDLISEKRMELTGVHVITSNGPQSYLVTVHNVEKPSA